MFVLVDVDMYYAFLKSAFQKGTFQYLHHEK